MSTKLNNVSLRLRRHLVYGMFLTSLILSMAPACTTTRDVRGFGVQENHVGYVPARIAVLPCTPWPTGARFERLPLTNVTDDQITDLCRRLDGAVIEGFTNQPFMKGYAPKYVSTLLNRAEKPEMTTQIPELWFHREDDCNDCPHGPAFYHHSVADRPAWQAWLSEFSEATSHADALLLPFLMFAYQRAYDDRGLIVVERAFGVTLLLIDTNDGSLVWAGGRQAAIPRRRLRGSVTERPQDDASQMAPWEDVAKRVFTEELWRAFPGRQIY